MVTTASSLRHPFATWKRVKARARAERRTGVPVELRWREDELWEALRGCVAWEHCAMLIRLHQNGVI